MRVRHGSWSHELDELGRTRTGRAGSLGPVQHWVSSGENRHSLLVRWMPLHRMPRYHIDRGGTNTCARLCLKCTCRASSCAIEAVVSNANVKCRPWWYEHVADHRKSVERLLPYLWISPLRDGWVMMRVMPKRERVGEAEQDTLVGGTESGPEHLV